MIPVFLVGMRGSGKTTVGKLLARMLDFAFVDLDEEFVKNKNITIAEFVARNGWAAFRQAESEILRDILLEHKNDVIIATGGGVVLAEENCGFMRSSGHVIWLDASPECCAGRISQNPQDAQRPALTSKGLLEEMREIHQKRHSAYEDAAHARFDAFTDAEQICSEIIPYLEQIDEMAKIKFS